MISPNKKLETLLKDQQLKELGADFQLVLKNEKLSKTYNLENDEEYNKVVEKCITIIVDSYSEKKLAGK